MTSLRAYLIDEGGAHNLLDEAVYYNRLVKERFPRLSTTTTIGGGIALGHDEIGQLSTVVDFLSANRFAPDIARLLSDRGKPFGLYIGAGSTPAGARLFFGFHGWKSGACQGQQVSDEKHGGQQSVRIDVPATGANSAVTVLVWPQYGDGKLNLTLEGERTYEFAAWVKWKDRGVPPELRVNVPSSAVTSYDSLLVAEFSCTVPNPEQIIACRACGSPAHPVVCHGRHRGGVARCAAQDWKPRARSSAAHHGPPSKA